jgi:hypothetical protein
MNQEIEHFLDECRAEQWFRDHPAVLEGIETFLAKVYRSADDDPGDQALCDRISEIVGKTNQPLHDRYVALRDLLAGLLKS